MIFKAVLQSKLLPLAILLTAMFVSFPTTAIAQPSSPAAAPSVTIEGNRITARGVTHGGSVLFFGVGLEQSGFYSVERRWSVVQPDDDNDGTVVLESKIHIPWKSIWVVADLRTAQYTVAVPSGYPLRRPAKASSLRTDPVGNASKVAFPGASLDAVYLHPGGAVWKVRSIRGWPNDVDHRPDATTVSLADFELLTSGADARPAAFLPGGILVNIDANEMQVEEIRLDAALIRGAH